MKTKTELKTLIKIIANRHSIPLGGTLSNRLLAKAIVKNKDEEAVAEIITLSLLLADEKYPFLRLFYSL